MYNQCMQDKHFIIIHKDEDRDIFINKLNYPKTIFHVGDNPQPGDIVVDKNCGNQSLLFNWILDNFDNLPEFIIFSQAIPDDHVHEPLLAIESTLTSGYGSFCYARAIHDQYTLSWVRINPIRDFAHKLGLGFINDINICKPIYVFSPGEIFYVSKNKILEKPKSFYENLISWNNDEKFFDLVDNIEYPNFIYKYIDYFHPEIQKLSKAEKVKELTKKVDSKTNGYSGWCYEALWEIIWADKKTFDMFNSSQACLGNKLYFNTEENFYDCDFHFSKFPYSYIKEETLINFKILENDWFDWDCPKYLLWREKLKEKTLIEGERLGFDGEDYLRFLKASGYKHISL